MATSDINPNSMGLLQGLFQGFAQYSQAFNRAVLGTFGSLAAIFDFYSFYQTYKNNDTREQRKTKLASYLINFALNALYTTGAVLKLLSALALNAICIGIDLVTLSRAAYETHQARRNVAKTKQEIKNIEDSHEPSHENARFERAAIGSLRRKLENAREHRFKSKIDVGFTAASAATSFLFTAGLFFPPLFAVALGAFITVKIVQIIDTKTNNGIIRCLGNLWNTITGKNKTGKPTPFANADASVALLDDSENISANPKVITSKKMSSKGVINNTFVNQGNKMLADHTRLFQKPKNEPVTSPEHHLNPRPFKLA